jgi:hypothetical protein
MAKDKDVKATNGDANKADEAVVEEKKKLSADEKKKLFEAYDKVETKFVELEKQREKLLAERVIAVKAIHDGIGKGPFQWKGNQLTVVNRGENFYFRGKDNTEVEAIG